jgi:hypothetical protein
MYYMRDEGSIIFPSNDERIVQNIKELASSKFSLCGSRAGGAHRPQ